MFDIKHQEVHTVCTCLNCMQQTVVTKGLHCRNEENGPHLTYLGQLQMVCTTVNYKLHYSIKVQDFDRL